MRLNLALLCVALAAGCMGSQVTELQGVQVSEYKGEKLSSIDDFRENSIQGPQIVNVTGYRLHVSGLVDKPMSLTYDEVIALPRFSKVIQLDCVEGWSVKLLWEGVLVRDILAQAGPKANANTVIFHAADGYTSSLPLAYFMERDILLAYGMNNVTLPAARGFPFQLAAEDKWGYKWVKWVDGIELSDDPDYKGYWESRGYADGGDRDKSQYS